MDPTAIAANGAVSDASTIAAHQQSPQNTQAADPADARSFAQMVQQGQSPRGASATTAAADPSSTALGSAIRSSYVSAGEEAARQAARLEEMRESMFAAIHEGNTNDVVYQAMMLQTQSLELFSSIHVTSSIGSAGTNLFNSLLKNQQ